KVEELCADDFAVRSGDDFTVRRILAGGGKGVISVVSNVIPGDMAAMINAFEAGNLEKARELHYRMSPIMDGCFLETNPIPVKAALAMMGKIEYELRLPMCKMSEPNYQKLKKIMTDYGLIW
ncbi:MAG: dihydrodipicolinate synthase family protein, partial [Syntrophales bacterium]|nr:dihydrodipicolinate synthase family protein [Syntrophales bacterium]